MKSNSLENVGSATVTTLVLAGGSLSYGLFVKPLINRLNVGRAMKTGLQFAASFAVGAVEATKFPRIGAGTMHGGLVRLEADLDNALKYSQRVDAMISGDSTVSSVSTPTQTQTNQTQQTQTNQTQQTTNQSTSGVMGVLSGRETPIANGVTAAGGMRTMVRL